VKKIDDYGGQVAQGDLVCTKIGAIPEAALAVPDAPRYTVQHSETGHDHVVCSRPGKRVQMFTSEDPMVCYLRVEGEVELEHLRDYDTHESIGLSPGDYEIRRQREYTPEGFRMVID
jgi:hypothetical protein